MGEKTSAGDAPPTENSQRSTNLQCAADSHCSAHLKNSAKIENVDEQYPSTTHYGYAENKDNYLRRLKRIEGQVRGISRMIDEDKYCIDILTQISAINKALHSLSIGLLEEHIGHCVIGAAYESQETGDQSIVENKITEATQAISQLLRS